MRLKASLVLGRLGGWSEDWLADLGRLYLLAQQAVVQALLGPSRGQRFRLRSSVEQTQRAGVDSLPLVMLISFLVGMILALQSAYQLRQLGAQNLVASLVAVSVVRELAPLLTAILVAGRVGSAVAAELGTMKVSQEIDALTVMGIDPVAALVVPRLLALTLAVPCLTLFADAVGILGGGFVATTLLGMRLDTYLLDSLNALQLQDLIGGVLKATLFGATIGLVGCHQGLSTRGGANEVGVATTRAVVRSIVLIIGVDLVVTALLYLQG